MHPGRYGPGKEWCSARCNDRDVRQNKCYYAAVLNIAVISVTEVGEGSSQLISNQFLSDERTLCLF